MDNKETQTIGFRVTADELAQLDARASDRGMSRAELVHAVVFAPDNSARIAQLEKQLHRTCRPPRTRGGTPGESALQQPGTRQPLRRRPLLHLRYPDAEQSLRWA